VTVSGQWLGKHVPVARQQTINNETVGCNNTRAVFSVWSMMRCYKKGTKLGVQLSSAQEAVKRGPEHVKLKNIN
jgi:hypothetical protein